jgi:hypothetical protein
LRDGFTSSAFCESDNIEGVLQFVDNGLKAESLRDNVAASFESG